MVATQPAQPLPGPGVGGLQEETPEGQHVSDGQGGVCTVCQAGGQVPALHLVYGRLSAPVRADRPPAPGTQRRAGAETHQARPLLLSGGEDGRGLRQDQFSGFDVSDSDKVSGIFPIRTQIISRVTFPLLPSLFLNDPEENLVHSLHH